MPASKIILILRHPWDLAVSLFKQRYVDNISFASSMFNIGVQIANFEMCILFWLQEKVIDENVLTINYEKLVENFEEHQKKLYEFCNINAQYEPTKRESFFLLKQQQFIKFRIKYIQTLSKKSHFYQLSQNLLMLFTLKENFGNQRILSLLKMIFFGYNI